VKQARLFDFLQHRYDALAFGDRAAVGIELELYPSDLVLFSSKAAAISALMGVCMRPLQTITRISSCRGDLAATRCGGDSACAPEGQNGSPARTRKTLVTKAVSEQLVKEAGKVLMDAFRDMHESSKLASWGRMLPV
jgi:hypothetical protein